MRSIFLGVCAYLGRIDGETRCAFWAEEPVDHGFDPARLIAVDLARSPSAARLGRISWDAVEVDDCFTATHGGLDGTTLGPRWPELQIMGVVCLERGHRERLPDAVRPEWPQRGIPGRDYEHTTVLYWPGTRDPRAGKRYAGHHARIVEERGSLARVAVYPPGTSQTSASPITMWMDLHDPEQCDAGLSSLTRIGVGDAAKEGPLFLVSGSS